MHKAWPNYFRNQIYQIYWKIPSVFLISSICTNLYKSTIYKRDEDKKKHKFSILSKFLNVKILFKQGCGADILSYLIIQVNPCNLMDLWLFVAIFFSSSRKCESNLFQLFISLCTWLFFLISNKTIATCMSWF